MSLVNQLIAAVLAVLFGLASVTLYIVSDSSKRMLMNQLESHALDTATHLGLYLAPYIASHDQATVETTVNAIFDSGFYRQIDVVTANRERLFSKSTEAVIDQSVPQWFVDLVKLDPPSMTREVTFNWNKVGSIYVQGHPGYAYQAYWRTAKEMLVWFVLLSLVASLAIMLLLRVILKPLKGVEQQAMALSHKQYIEQPSIPATRELRRVVLAMNQMVKQVHQMFEEQSKNIEELRRSAYQDELTGLPNARATRAQLGEHLDHREDFGPGTLFYVHIDGLQELNQRLGQEKTNNFIRLVAERLADIAAGAAHPIIGRLSGADFVLLIERRPADALQRLVNGLLAGFDEHYRQLAQDATPRPAPVQIGIAHGSDKSSSSELLSNGRLALETAAKERKREHQYFKPGARSSMKAGTSMWPAPSAMSRSSCRPSRSSAPIGRRCSRKCSPASSTVTMLPAAPATLSAWFGNWA
ncbi:LapD/MoxY N-terminal periplasmic domain-containing protein [Marinobacterium aestuariivivens]|uniref:LapD/MoxY N-terminal periplasmic domain-containing protein n=1 Tax=Marinobacterium aestuariivivens TaxID=1698799 RepID=A0ABW2A844_9GAMM